MNRIFVFSLVSTLGLGSLALAQPSGAAGSGAAEGGRRGHHGAKRFEKLDTNGDGAVSLDELKASMRERFTAADANKDGKTTKSELKAHFEAKRAQWAKKRGDDAGMKGRRHGPHGDKGDRFFGKLDTNGNDAIEKSEIDAAAQARFGKLDQNGDGKLTPDEMRHGRRGGCGKHGKGGKRGAMKS